jgi:AraC family transcriptional regulator
MRLRLGPGQLHGENLKSHQFGSVRVTETLHPAGLKTQRHSHELALFCFVREGGFSEVYGRRRRECVPLQVIFRPPDEAHTDRFYDAGARCLTVELGVGLLQRLREYSVIPEDSRDFYGGKYAWLAAKLYGEFVRMDAASALAVEGLTLELIAEASRTRAEWREHSPPRWLEQAEELLRAHFSEPLTIEAVAQAVDVHPVRLARAFRRTYRHTIGEHVRRLRVEFACRAIAGSDTPLTEIALSAGFYDQSHFTRTFKSATGVTPSAYRTAFRAG